MTEFSRVKIIPDSMIYRTAAQVTTTLETYRKHYMIGYGRGVVLDNSTDRANDMPNGRFDDNVNLLERQITSFLDGDTSPSTLNDIGMAMRAIIAFKDSRKEINDPDTDECFHNEDDCTCHDDCLDKYGAHSYDDCNHDSCHEECVSANECFHTKTYCSCHEDCYTQDSLDDRVDQMEGDLKRTITKLIEDVEFALGGMNLQYTADLTDALNKLKEEAEAK